MEVYKTSCDCCDLIILDERNYYEYEPLGIVVCAVCYDMLLSGPTEPDEVDELADMLDEMSTS
jgi:hypothetical protein